MFARNKKPVSRNVEYSRDNVVERAGYITTQKRVENIINAGKNLADFRKQIYTNELESSEPEINRAARKDYDFADFHNDAKELNRRIKEKFSQQKMAEEKKREEAKKALREATGIDFEDSLGEYMRTGKVPDFAAAMERLKENTIQKGGEN